MFDPLKDGIDHINVYSKARTGLGIFLSNFTKCDLETEDGEFASVEGYWFWLGATNNSEREKLRSLWGWEAKRVGTELRDVSLENRNEEIFQNKIKQAIRYKIENSKFKQEFIKSTLPFAHYYVYNGKINTSASGQWIIIFLEEFRNELRTSQVPSM